MISPRYLLPLALLIGIAAELAWSRYGWRLVAWIKKHVM